MTVAQLKEILKDVPDDYTVNNGAIYSATGVQINPDAKVVAVV